MIDSIVFIGAVIAGITEAIRYLVPKVNGAITVGVAALTGLIVGFVDESIGVVNVSPAEGLMAGLAVAGVAGIAKKVG